MRNSLGAAKNTVFVAFMALGVAPVLAVTDQEFNDLRNQLKDTQSRLDTIEAASDQVSALSHVSVGGYGELHYNNLTNDGTDAVKKEIDFHRFIMFLGYDFSEAIRFRSEVELEHAFLEGENECELDGVAVECDSTPGELELEQAYLEFDLPYRQRVKTGVFLVPVGILNETHEPPTFYGVERNSVETRILPTTWREAGVDLTGRVGGGLSYDLAAHSGLMTDSSYVLRGGRQNAGEASAHDNAITGRIRWKGLPGLEWGLAAQYQADLMQSQPGTEESPASLVETHVVASKGPVALRALYARWDIDSTGAELIGADQQTGWYVEPAYKVLPKVGVFARHSRWDLTAGDDASSGIRQNDVGFNFWPHPQVVLKADYQWQTAENKNNASDGFNLGVGYQF